MCFINLNNSVAYALSKWGQWTLQRYNLSKGTKLLVMKSRFKYGTQDSKTHSLLSPATEWLVIHVINWNNKKCYAIVFCGNLYIHEHQHPWSSPVVCVCVFVCGYKCSWVRMPLQTHTEVRGQQRILPLLFSTSFVVVILLFWARVSLGSLGLELSRYTRVV